LLRAVLSFDPLMHHGLMFIGRSKFGRYEETFLPVATLRLARVLYGSNVVELTFAGPDLARAKRRLRQAVAALRKQIQSGVYSRSDYHLKNFISGVLLLPALYLASRSVFVYKRDSFALAKSEFKSPQWALIERAEELRLSWRQSPGPRFISTLLRAFHPRAAMTLSARVPTRRNVRRLLERHTSERIASEAAALFEGLDHTTA